MDYNERLNLAQKEYEELGHWYYVQCEKRKEELKAKGIYKPHGLDGDNHFFSDITEEYNRRFWAIVDKYDLREEE